MSKARLTLALASERREIARLVDAIEHFGAANHVATDDVHSVQLLLDEIIINVIKHGYGDAPGHAIDIDLTLEGGLLRIRVADDARPFDPTQAPAPNMDLPIEERPIGGLGIHIARSLVSSMSYERTGGRNVLTMLRTMANDY